MIVCGTLLTDGTCGKEMRCIKTGMNVWIDAHYINRGDLFECPRCKSRVVVGNRTNQHCPEPVKVDEWTVKLDEGRLPE